jgi:uncharacterized protein YbaP (TraB family)
MFKFARPLAGLCAAMLALAAVPAQAAPAIWAVKDADSTIYLFGTVHVTTADTVWRTPLYDRAYAEAGEVWLEADVFTDMEQLRLDMAAEGLDDEGRLERRIGKRDFARLVKALKPLGVDAAVARHLEPWFAAVMLLGANMSGSGLQTETGAEQTVTDAARRDGKGLRYFESVSDQVQALATMSEDSQVTFLRDILKVGKDTPAAVNEMTAAWIAGDEGRLTEEVIAEVKRQSPEMYEALFRRRNLVWLGELEHEMAGSGVDLVTVGAGHLLGDDGLVALLHARGYAVERVQ